MAHIHNTNNLDDDTNKVNYHKLIITLLFTRHDNTHTSTNTTNTNDNTDNANTNTNTTRRRGCVLRGSIYRERERYGDIVSLSTHIYVYIYTYNIYIYMYM